ncbi:MAG: hypothetical protein JRF52_02750 [Deltaproteobacteria bacterium]|nr:hypothetical protein [Deltaproteobacteria bacterium]
MKKCPYCKTQFIPHPKVGDRQKTCGKPACKAALKSDNNRKWCQRNPDYYSKGYSRLKDWLEENPGYLKRYRGSHPEYVKKNRDAQRVRDRRKKLHLDIQAQLKRQIPEITNELWESSNLDIQAQLDVKPLEITFVLSTLPCLDMQFQLDRAFHTGENVAISCRR